MVFAKNFRKNFGEVLKSWNYFNFSSEEKFLGRLNNVFYAL